MKPFSKSNQPFALICVAFLMAIWVAACQPAPAVSVPEVAPAATAQMEPTLTPTSSVTLATPTSEPANAIADGFLTAEGQTIQTIIQWTEGTLNKALLSPGGETIAAGFSNGLKLFDASTFAELPSIAEGEMNVLDMEFSQDGRYLALMTTSEVIVYDWQAKGVKWRIPCQINNAESASQKEQRLIFSHTGDTLAALIDFSLVAIDVNTGAERGRIQGYTIEEAAFSLDDSRLIVLWNDYESEKLGAFDPLTLQELNSTAFGDYSSLRALSSDRRYAALAFASTDVIELYDLDTLEVVASIDLASTNQSAVDITSMAIDPAGLAFLASFKGSEAVLWWDVATDSPSAVQAFLPVDEKALIFNQVGQRFGSYSDHGYALWDASTAQLIAWVQLNAETGGTLSGLFYESANGVLFSSGADGNLRIWMMR